MPSLVLLQHQQVQHAHQLAHRPGPAARARSPQQVASIATELVAFVGVVNFRGLRPARFGLEGATRFLGEHEVASIVHVLVTGGCRAVSVHVHRPAGGPGQHHCRRGHLLPCRISAPQQSQIFTGKFVSQAPTTQGTVRLNVTPTKVELELEDFSTGDGGDLYVHLNPGKLGPNAAGEMVLSSSQMYVVAPLKARTGAQSYDLTPMWPGLPEVLSVTVYQYSA